MIRTQIQLSESQMEQLKDIPRRREVALAELIREGADMVIRNSGTMGREERKKQAIAATGTFHSGCGDLAEEHDRHLVDDYSK